MISIFYDDIHQLRYEVLKTAFLEAKLSCSRMKSPFSKIFWKFGGNNIVLISHPANYFKSILICLLSRLINKKITIDFYDLHLIRTQHQKVPFKIIVSELVLIFLATMFFTRSGEINYFKKNHAILCRNKNIIFLPDVNLCSPFYDKKRQKNQKYILFGGTYIKALNNFVTENKKATFLIYGMPVDYIEKLNKSKSITFKAAVEMSFDKLNNLNLSNYTGLHFADLERKLYKRSASIKYLTYLQLGLQFYTDKCHRLARLYSYLYPGQVLFHGQNKDVNLVTKAQKIRAKKRFDKLKNSIVRKLNENYSSK